MATIRQERHENDLAELRGIVAEALGERCEDLAIRNRLVTSRLTEVQTNDELQQAHKDTFFAAVRNAAPRWRNARWIIPRRRWATPSSRCGANAARRKATIPTTHRTGSTCRCAM